MQETHLMRNQPQLDCTVLFAKPLTLSPAPFIGSIRTALTVVSTGLAGLVLVGKVSWLALETVETHGHGLGFNNVQHGSMLSVVSQSTIPCKWERSKCLALRSSQTSQSPGPARLQEVQNELHIEHLLPSLVYMGSLNGCTRPLLKGCGKPRSKPCQS